MKNLTAIFEATRGFNPVVLMSQAMAHGLATVRPAPVHRNRLAPVPEPIPPHKPLTQEQRKRAAIAGKKWYWAHHISRRKPGPGEMLFKDWRTQKAAEMGISESYLLYLIYKKRPPMVLPELRRVNRRLVFVKLNEQTEPQPKAVGSSAGFGTERK